MSLILDALKKLEQDRAARRKRPIHIASDILNGREPGKKRKTWVLMAGLAGTVFTAGVLTIAVTAPFLPLTPIQEQAKTKETQAAPPADSRPAPRAEGTTVSAAPAKRADVAGQPAGAATAPAAETDDPASIYPVKAKKRAALKKGPERYPAGDTIQVPDLKVTAIVWVEKRSGRRAMVNDMMVSEGDSVEGARVVDIYQDYIRFSYDGRNINVHMR